MWASAECLDDPEFPFPCDACHLAPHEHCRERQRFGAFVVACEQRHATEHTGVVAELLEVFVGASVADVEQEAVDFV